jgi:hypothetical protein
MGVIIFGQKLYGKVDHVPGLFYVSTRFFHLDYVPLIPLGSFIVMEGTEQDGNFKGMPVPLSGKSIFFGWLRAALLIAAVVGVVLLILGAIELADPRRNQDWTKAGIGIGVSLAAVLLLWGSYRISRAGPMRALDLADKAGIPPEVLTECLARSKILRQPELAPGDENGGEPHEARA